MALAWPLFSVVVVVNHLLVGVMGTSLFFIVIGNQLPVGGMGTGEVSLAAILRSFYC